MKKLTWLFCFLSFFINGQNIGISSIDGATIKRAHNIYFMGDSFTSADVFPAAVITNLGSGVWSEVNFGITGQTTTQMVARFYEVSIADAEYVVILGGANDLQGGLVAATTITNNLQIMATAAKNAGAKVIMLTTTPFATNAGWTAGAQTIQNTVNTAITSTAGIANVDYRIDIYTGLGAGTNTLQPAYNSGDGLHPNTTGYNLIASTITSAITFTANTSTPVVSFGKNLVFNQSVYSGATPVFKGIRLVDSLNMGANVINTTGQTNLGTTAITGNLSATGNETVTGIIYSSNSFQLGTSSAMGNITSNATDFKIGSASATPNVVLYTSGFPNGRFKIFNSSGNCMAGDAGSATDNAADALQVWGSFASPQLNVTGITGTLTPSINLKTASGNSAINFLSTANSNTYATISANISTGEIQYFARSGGYFPTFYSNGVEKMRIATGGQVLIGNTSATATLNVTGTGSVSSNFTSGATITGVNLNVTGTNTLTGNTTHGGHIIGASSAPTSTVGAGAGSGATATLTTCTDLSGHISITTAGTPTGSNTVVITLTFASAFATPPKVVLSATGPNSAALNGTTQVYATTTTTTLLINSGTVGLTTGTIYTWDYTITQ